MAQTFGAGSVRRFLTVRLRQTTTILFPALVRALDASFKVAVMAELLANAGGISGALADAHINLDIATAFAWVLIAVEYTLVHPVKGEIDRWRRAALGGSSDECVVAARYRTERRDKARSWR